MTFDMTFATRIKHARHAKHAKHKIRFREIHQFFNRRHLLDGVSLSLASGTATLLCGENGSGKTTLLRILAGIEKPSRCLAHFDDGGGIAWAKCRKQLQAQIMYLHQQPYLFDGDVRHNLSLAAPLGMPKLQRMRQIRRALEWAQLDSIADTRGKSLSSGEKQRVALARAWLRQARFLLLDEPIANMDGAARARTVALLQRLKTAGAGLLIASHNQEFFSKLIDNRLLLDGGKLVEAQPPTLPDNVTRLAGNPKRARTSVNNANNGKDFDNAAR